MDVPSVFLEGPRILQISCPSHVSYRGTFVTVAKPSTETHLQRRTERGKLLGPAIFLVAGYRSEEKSCFGINIFEHAVKAMDYVFKGSRSRDVRNYGEVQALTFLSGGA